VPESDEELITSGEVARRLGVTPRAVGRWVARGLITPAVTTPGGRYRFRWSEVAAQLREQQARNSDDS
jgi:excisionase family DNA binding protein